MQVQYQTFSCRRSFGIELEADASVSKKQIANAIRKVCEREVKVAEWAQSRSNNYWHIKEDSTCGPNADTANHVKDYGVEIASYKASGIKDVVHIASVAERLRELGVRTNRNCGFHIHGEITDYTPAQAGILLARWIKIEPVISCLVAQHRLANIHCKLFSCEPRYDVGRTYTGKQFWELMKPTRFEPSNNPHKRVALNFVNYAQSLLFEEAGHVATRKTVELRYPEAVLCGDDIANWVKLFLMFIETSSTATMPKNLLPITDLEEFFQYTGLSGSSSFFILSRSLFKTKHWVLDKIINSPWVRYSRIHKGYWDQAEEKMRLISEAKNAKKVRRAAI